MCLFLLVFVLIFEFSSGDGGDFRVFRVFRLVVVLVTWWGFGFGADWKVSVNVEPVFAREREATREAVQKRPAESLWTAERVADRVGSNSTRILLRVEVLPEAARRFIMLVTPQCSATRKNLRLKGFCLF